MNLTRILFLGNSFTFVNNLPSIVNSFNNTQSTTTFWGFGAATFQSLSKSYNFNNNTFDVVVMQEQSMFLAMHPSFYRQNSVPWAITLAKQVRAPRIVLLETWAYQNGNPSFLTGLNDTYSKMQARLKTGYEYTASELTAHGFSNVSIAYAGEAWGRAAKLNYKLWQQDGQHPSLTGSYLAACVVYRTIHGRAPPYRARKGLSKRTALELIKLSNK
jgi:hypothetical protein